MKLGCIFATLLFSVLLAFTVTAESLLANPLTGERTNPVPLILLGVSLVAVVALLVFGSKKKK